MTGLKGHVLGIERDYGRPMVRVECVAHIPRYLEWTEDNEDGTHTDWRGMVYDDEENTVTDEVQFEALIELRQVIETWDEAFIAVEVRKMENILEYHRDRI